MKAYLEEYKTLVEKYLVDDDIFFLLNPPQRELSIDKRIFSPFSATGLKRLDMSYDRELGILQEWIDKSKGNMVIFAEVFPNEYAMRTGVLQIYIL